MTANTNQQGVEIPWERLPAETLRRIVEEFVTRDGTDNGYDASLDERVGQVLGELRKGRAYVSFDLATETCHVVSR